MHGKLSRPLTINFLFAVSMAFLESAVVVYLRAIFYPDGFHFPLVDIPPDIFRIEIGREAATIIMLWAVARLQAKNWQEWFSWFAFNFGVWDIFYYIWLKVFLNWPAGLLDWDILFLIPLPWVSPVLAPVLVSLALISAAVIILRLRAGNMLLVWTKADWLVEILCGLLIIFSFLFQLEALAKQQSPQDYPWWLFLPTLLFGFGWFLFRVRKTVKSPADAD